MTESARLPLKIISKAERLNNTDKTEDRRHCEPSFGLVLKVSRCLFVVTHSRHISCETLAQFPRRLSVCTRAPRVPAPHWIPRSRLCRRRSCAAALQADSSSGPISWEISDHGELCVWNGVVDETKSELKIKAPHHKRPFSLVYLLLFWDKSPNICAVGNSIHEIFLYHFWSKPQQW